MCAAILALTSIFAFAAAASASAPKAPQPCSLVTAKQMDTVTHLHGAKEVLAPLGPTCIYTFSKTKTEITIAVQTRKFSSVVAQLSARKRVVIRSREGYCGKLGLPMLFVSLPHGRVLTITAGCAVGQKIAAVALARLNL